MKKAIIVGGSNGIGMAIALQLNGYDRIVIIDREMPDDRLRNKVCVEYEQFDLNSNDFSLFDKHNDADMLMITAGIGRLALFEDTTEEMIATCMQINATATMRIIKRFYNRLTDKKTIYVRSDGEHSGIYEQSFLLRLRCFEGGTEDIHRERERGTDKKRHRQPHTERQSRFNKRNKIQRRRKRHFRYSRSCIRDNKPSGSAQRPVHPTI